MSRVGAVALALALLALAPVAMAEEHEVQMLNKGPNGERNWFEPAVVYAEPGDTIHFVSVDKGHNSASIEVPEGAETWNGKLSEDTSVTVSAEGLYAYKCTPHFGLGMLGFIVVGDPSVNFDAVANARYPGLARQVAGELLEQIKGTM